MSLIYFFYGLGVFPVLLFSENPPLFCLGLVAIYAFAYSFAALRAKDRNDQRLRALGYTIVFLIVLDISFSAWKTYKEGNPDKQTTYIR